MNGIAAATATDLLLSLDVPLTLLMVILVVLRARQIQAQRSRCHWIWPRALEPATVRWLFRARWIGLLQWPGGLALAALLLSCGTTAAQPGPGELLLSAFVGFSVGAAAAFALRGSAQHRQRASNQGTLLLGKGFGAIAIAPFREVREYVDLRRLLLIAAPAMLAAPVGATASNVAASLALWLPLILLVLVAREAMAVDRGMRQWLAHASVSGVTLSFHAWRHVAALFAAVLAISALTLGIQR